MPAPTSGTAAQVEARSQNSEIAVAAFRTVLLLIVLFSPQFMEARGTRGALLVAAVIAAASYNLALFILHVRAVPVPRVVIVIGDVLLVSLWIYFCGPGAERFFVLYYPVAMIAGIWFGVAWASVAAVFASAGYVFALSIAPVEAAERAPTSLLVVQILFLIVTATVVSVVAELREVERQMLVSERSRATLQEYWQRIRTARHVEEMVRPSRLPAAAGLDVAVRFRPAATAESGDYYDLIPLGERRWGACIADVRGKFRLGAVYLPTFKTALRFAARHRWSPAEVFTEVNRLVEAETAEKADLETFISLCYAVIDLDEGSLTYANAGHEPPVLIRGSGGGVAELRGTGMVLGVVPEATYTEEKLPLRTGDAIVMFTDGMTEVADRRNRMLGRERFLEQVQARTSAGGAQAMVGRVFDYVTEYGRDGQRRDDMTLFVIRVTATDVGSGGTERGEDT